MPRIGPVGRDKSDRDRQEEILLAAWREFEQGFQRSRTGSLWREYEGKRLVIFRHKDRESFGWSITGPEEETRWSPYAGYDTEEDAMGGLWDAVGD